MSPHITFDDLNIYVNSKVPTNRYLKPLLFIFNLTILIALFWFAIGIQDERPNVFPFLFPIAYFLTMGRYLLWNTFGEEFYIISSTHVSHQHNYGFWRTKLKTSKYDTISIDRNDIEIEENTYIKLIFTIYDSEKLPQIIFRTTIPITHADSNRIFNRLNEIKIDEFSGEVNFPKIFAN